MSRDRCPAFANDFPESDPLDARVFDLAEDTSVVFGADRYVINSRHGIIAIGQAQGFVAWVESFIRSHHISNTLLNWGAAVLRPYMASLRYFRRAPTSTSSAKPARTGRPSGPTEAATIMPFDSTPRSLRGARFTTTTTLRPMRDSGS